MAFAIGFVVMCFLRCCVGCIVWFSLFAIVFLFAGLALMFFYQAGMIGDVGGAATFAGVPDEGSPHSDVYGWICVGLSGFFLLVILCCCSRIRLAVAVCKCAGKFVGEVCLIILVPIFQAILAVGVWVACVVVMIYLISASEFVATTDDYISGVKSYSDESLIRFYIFVFATLWVNAFIGAMTIFVIASACVMWYYSHGPGQELELPIARSYRMIFRYYIGPLAFGSLLIAIVQFIQLVVELFKRQAEANGGDNKCLEYVVKCIQCCLACVECIIKFINTQAYIQIAIRGKNFCYAAKDGFELAWSNVVRFAVVGGVGTVIMFIGKIMIAAGTATCFYLLITYGPPKDNYLQPFYQVLLVFIIGYVVGMLFMSVYSVAMDALLQCFLVDELNNKGKGKPKYAPDDLADVMDLD